MLGEALADGLALRQEERIGHPATEDQEIDLGEQMVDDADLVAHLGAAEDGRERPFGLLEKAAQGADLALHQQARVGRQVRRDPDGRGMGSVGGAECVVDEDVGVGREDLGEAGVVLLLLGVEPEVLEEDRLTVTHPLDRILGAHAERVAGDGHVPPKELAESLADGAQPQPVLDLAVWPPEMAGEDDPGALVEKGRDRRQGGPDP